MSVRPALRLVRGSSVGSPKTGAIATARWTAILSDGNASTTWTQSRGAKSRTTVKASSLPQGALPPLRQDETETPPERTYPPVLQQHLNNIRNFPDCIILTRVGDFYEMYFDQVEQYAPLVNLKKAKRATALGDVPMAGFQHTQLDRYLKMFVQDHGKRVAISEQIRLPESERLLRMGGPLYDRKVTRIITAGTLIDENFMDPYESNHLLAIYCDDAWCTSPEGINDSSHSSEQLQRSLKIGLSWADVSSGDFYTQTSDLAALPSLIARTAPREVVLNSSMKGGGETLVRAMLADATCPIYFHDRDGALASISDWAAILARPVPLEQQIEYSVHEVEAGSLLLDYLHARLRDTHVQLQPPIRRSDSESMIIDKQSLRSLELRTTLKDGFFQGSLLHAIRQTVTKSGARLLTQRLLAPSMSIAVINSRLDLVQEMLAHDGFREDVIALLRRTHDTYRLLQKFSVGRGDADDLLSLSRTVDMMQQISQIIRDRIVSRRLESSEEQQDKDLSFLQDIVQRIDLDTPLKVSQNIQSAIDEEGLNRQHTIEEMEELQAELMTEKVINADAAREQTPKLSRQAAKSTVQPSKKDADARLEDIWTMRRNASQTLSRAHKDLDQLMDVKQDLAAKLRKELKAESLTLKWSAQLGHFCHIKGRDAQGHLAAKSGVRIIGSTKSTRSFYLSDWTHLGVRIDDAKLRIRTEEDRVFQKLRAEVLENLMKLRRNAAVLDELDVACSSASVARQRRHVRPIVNETTAHRIFGGRHPTVDAGLDAHGRQFTSNDCTVGDGEKVFLITGPNMAGKSTYLRQNALITILAQTGCFVPAEYAELGLVDKVFSRVGSADNLFQDQSTFMVEMLETAEILRHATPRSFVIMDEVGRGTTPEDGVAVGYACLHHLHHVNRCRSLFATHFHALADMTRDFRHLARYCTDVVEESDGSWTYMHKLRKGVNRDSHALKVARMAGMPDSCMSIAAGVLAKLREKRTITADRKGKD